MAGLQYSIPVFSFPSSSAPPFVGNMTQYEVRSMIYAALQEYWPNATDTNPLPGGAEYNHIGPNSMGPLKTNRTIPCPYESLSIEEQEQQCYSYQEFVYVVPMLITTLKPTLKHRTSDVSLPCVF